MTKLPPGHPELVTIEQFEALPWSCGCGPCPGLTSGFRFDRPGGPSEGFPLFCKGCGTAVVWWGG